MKQPIHLITAQQMRDVEADAIASGQVTGLELMERAGQGVVDAIFEEWPELADGARKAVVLCGPGNNGGDGFVVARLLDARGWDVQVFLYGEPEKLPPDAKQNFDIWAVNNVVEARFEAAAKIECDVFVDSVFGTGLCRPLSRELHQVLVLCISGHPRTVAIDIPSGFCADSGRWLGEDCKAVGANLVVTFHCAKRGHYLSDCAQYTSEISLKSIGLPNGLVNSVQLLNGVDRQDHSLAKRVQKRSIGGHKYTHGHLLVLSGGAGKSGAARLAARGALRIGAGLVTLGAPRDSFEEVAHYITAVMLTQIDGAKPLKETLNDERITALCLGPGLGVSRAQKLVPVALAANRSTVLDADALSAFADDPDELFRQLHDRCVLTPHGGEFTRLFPDIAAKLAAPAINGPAYSKVDATRDAAARAGCTVVFKGADTVIASPDGQCSVNSAHYDREAPWLATAGSGDVLAGFIAGLLARGLPPHKAAETAAWLHVECARKFGSGLIAEDLPEVLPMVFRDLTD